MTRADQIDALLPQTQCEQCGYPGCRPYAEAIAGGRADINQCPPGGQAGIDALADLLGQPSKPLNPANGEHRPPQVAWIDEAICIGCTKCIQACPVDAIMGARKLMHTVITEECTGCDLCLAPCPVDCIYLLPTEREKESSADQQARRDRARTRFNARKQRLRKQRSETKRGRHARPSLPDRETRQATVQAALARVRERRRERRNQS